MTKTIMLTTVMFLSGCSLSAEHYVNNVHVSLALAYLQQADLEKGRKILNDVLAKDSHDPATWSALAYLEERSGNDELAATAYRRAIVLNPHLGEYHNNYGVFLCRHHQPEKGIEEILKAIRFPTYIYRSSAFENAALCAKQIPDLKAAQTYHQAAERNAGK
jgi:type IV pilus assembly protein PilF